MPLRVPQLRTTLTIVTALVAVIALIVASALVLLTARMREVTVDLTAGIESVRFAEEAEVALLLFGRTSDALGQRRIAGDLRYFLERAGNYVTSDEERRVLAEASRHVEILIAMPRRDPGFVAQEALAFDALERLVNLNVAQARGLQQNAMAWDRLATTIGLASGGLVLLLGAAGIWWLRARAFTPVLSLAGAMEQFGRGNRKVRAREEGPRELRDMIVRFNELANALDTQHGAQAAFLAGVAHDLRTPLAALLLQLEWVRPDKPLPPEPTVRRVVDMARRQMLRLDRMLMDLVAITGMDAGAFRLELADHDLTALVRGAADLFEGVSSRHRLTLDLPPEPLIVHCDPLRIEQVVTNLLSNAVKYSPEGGAVTLTLRRDAAAAVLSVRDAGVGISAEEQRHLFEPFHRLDAARGMPGSGLGLYVVRRIVEGHGGRVAVESAPGEGSVFRVELPYNNPSRRSLPS